ncbi:MAG TPA: TlpA disulfide reductase family protein [Micromonosporaceae bacterium]
MRRLHRLASVVALVAAFAVGGCTSTERPATTAADSGGFTVFPAGQRQPAPQVTGDLLDGGRYDMSAHHGDVIVINFWASWCAPCRVEAADLEAVHQATRDSGVEFLGINSHDERDKATAFTQARRIDYPSIYDPAGRLGLDFDVPPTTFPTTFVIDREGKIAAVIRTSVRQDQLAPVVQRIAGEPRGG